MTDPVADRCAELADEVAPRRCYLGQDHDGDHAYPYRWRLDRPWLPSHVTCLREEQNGRLWVLVPDEEAWFQWRGGAIVGSARLLGEVSDLAPLVEHPDPRKATT